MIAGITRHKWQDNLINAIALLGFSIPVFWLALLLTLFCSLTLGWLPVFRAFRSALRSETDYRFCVD
ncbi:Peptide transport system permease protein sapB [Escherichia coli]|uniref:Peptide transport system permease protein sapB n=1 Tax=Escherichia coli TaxID=562 RepID=A0AAX2KFT0_ECOLX|nr:Peptide transport system permease protein sapB [Escherichia coli]